MIPLGPVSYLEKLERITERGNCHFRTEPVLDTPGRQYRPVAGVVGKRRRKPQYIEFIAFPIDKIPDLLRKETIFGQPGVFITESCADEIILSHRNAETDSRADDAAIERGDVRVISLGFLVIYVEAAAYAINRIVRVHVTQCEPAIYVAVVEGKLNTFPGPQEVVLGDAGLEYQALVLGKAQAGQKVAERLFGHCIIDVNLVRGTCYGRSLHVDFFEKAQSLQPDLPALYLGC